MEDEGRERGGREAKEERKGLGKGSYGGGRRLTESLQVRHMGPMAQDFFMAFGLGEDPTRISSVDIDGVRKEEKRR